MHDRKDGGDDRRGSRHEHGPDERHCERGESRGCAHGGAPAERHDERCGERPTHGGGPDTNFLQLEMSQVLYGEAQSVTRRAFRELLVEAAKARWRERFGDEIAGLAELAVDELMNDVLSSLDIEARIQGRQQERGRTQDRVRDLFAKRVAEHEGDARTGGAPRREGEGGGGEGSGDPGAG